MSLSISTNVPSLIAQGYVGRAASAVGSSLEKLSTGSRINRASDDPAGLITSEHLRAMLAALEAESRGAQRADAVANVADGALAEVSGLLNDANAAAVAAANTAGLSDAEREAYQMEIESARQSIDRIVSTTEFNGRKLLDGTFTLTSGDDLVAIPSISLPDGTQDSIAAAISEVSSLRAEIGAFQKHVLDAGSRVAGAAYENTAAANSIIRDTDFASESASLARANVLHRATLAALVLANSSPRSVLRILA